MAEILSQYMLSDFELDKVQVRLTEMACVIEDILNKHAISHSIMNGTLLGAVRHGGFVPWDDDYDFVVFNENYDEALDCLRKELPDWLFLEDEKSEPLYFHAWAHVKDLNTSAECKHFLQDNLYSHHGLSIDLYRIERLKLRNLCARGEEEYVNYISRGRMLGTMDDEEVKERLGKLEWITSNFWNYRMRSEDVKSIEREVYASVYTSRNYYEIEDFFPLKKYKFGDAEFWGPNDGDAVLTKCYGDYMELPPEEKRIPHYSKVEFLN
ncbi:LicD family protein [Butyrivibrio sp. FC2001]|uniref:LicD family protein n=1 Tax=Butyrivibrio sp. FC2001 TaxID=1280671 RepID=UPI000413B80E|nr:LicD family protein [Butyrivibrio sp. FC2001]